MECSSVGENTSTSTSIFTGKTWHGTFDNLVDEHISEIEPIIAAELRAEVCVDEKLAKRISRKVVLKQLDVTDLDDSD
jgi:hypothetical protein